MRYQALPYDVLQKYLADAGIVLTDNLFFVIVDFVEGSDAMLAQELLLEQIRIQDIDVIGWRCEQLERCPQYLGLVTPNGYIPLCFARCQN